MVSRTEKNKSKRKRIIKQDKRKKRKRMIINFLKVFSAVFIIISSILSYMYYASTTQLIVKEYSFQYDKLPNELNGLKIIQFGDLFYDNNYKYVINEIKNKINKIKPDIIVFTGNLLHNNFNLTTKEYNKLVNFLDNIDSTIGKYYVVGSNDNEKTIEILDKANFKFLDNSIEDVFYNITVPIKIYGITDKYDFDSNNEDVFKIVLVNDPKDINKIIDNISPDIIMAGKTLNGQIKIPFSNINLLNKEYQYYDSYYKVNNTDIFITGGIGTNNIPFRFFNHPSINFYRLRTK